MADSEDFMGGMFGGYGGGYGSRALLGDTNNISKMQILGALLTDLSQNAQGKAGSALPAMSYRMGKLNEKREYQDQLSQLFSQGTTGVQGPTFAPGSISGTTTVGPDRQLMAAPNPQIAPPQMLNAGGLTGSPAGQFANSRLAPYQNMMAQMDPDKGRALMLADALKDPDEPDYRVVGGNLVEVPKTAGATPRIAFQGPPEPPKRITVNRGNKQFEQEWDAKQGKFVDIPGSEAPRWAPQSQDGGGGRSIDERMQNVLLNGDPNTPQYAAAYGQLSRPRASINPETGQVVTIKQDLSWARLPMRDGKPFMAQPSVNVGQQVVVPQQTQEQKIASGFADRMGQAELDLSATEDALRDPSQVAKGAVPLVGNYLVNNKYQSADQAKRNWINAQLRRESGAVISDPEFDNANKQYFVRPGDSDETKKQKLRNRATAEAAMRRGSTNKIEAPSQSSAAPKPKPDAGTIRYDAQGNRI